MRMAFNRYVCEWCESEFPRPHPRGRHPHYCSRTCRQRAYESRRRGAYVLGLPRSPLPRPQPTRAKRAAYETGRNGTVRHALRPDGAADRYGMRPTLCGARAWVTRMAFEPWLHVPAAQRACETCRAIAQRFPSATPLDVSNDLARARHVLGRLRAVAASDVPSDAVRLAVTEALACADAALPRPAPGSEATNAHVA